MAVVWSIVAIVAVGYAIFAAAFYFMQSGFVYMPTHEEIWTPAEIDLEFEQINLTTEDGIKLAGWFIPADNAKTTVIFCYGQGGNMTHRLDTINILNGVGVNVLIFDYRGYGTSEGKPSEEGTYEDARTAYRWLKENKNCDNIIVWGRSLGAAIAANLASEVEVDGLVLESGFTSITAIGQKFYPYMPVKLFSKFSYSTIEHIKNVSCSVFVIHSRDDEVVPFEFGQQLYETVNEPKEFLEIIGKHNDGFLVSNDIYKDGIAEWLEKV